jgi:hypothetical protein
MVGKRKGSEIFHKTKKTHTHTHTHTHGHISDGYEAPNELYMCPKTEMLITQCTYINGKCSM